MIAHLTSCILQCIGIIYVYSSSRTTRQCSTCTRVSAERKSAATQRLKLFQSRSGSKVVRTRRYYNNVVCVCVYAIKRERNTTRRRCRAASYSIQQQCTYNKSVRSRLFRTIDGEHITRRIFIYLSLILFRRPYKSLYSHHVSPEGAEDARVTQFACERGCERGRHR